MQAINQQSLYSAIRGSTLLETALLNKGSAFSGAERTEFYLQGLLPDAIETIEQQATRAYQQFSALQSDLDRHVYLRNLQDTNETLFYRLLQDHLTEMVPIIYTPTVGQACQQFSQLYRRARGLFISYPQREQMDQLLRNVTQHNIKVIVVTDGERILGLGDLGAGGMGIPIGKLSLYTLCGGINPAHTLPIMLDVGTNNPHCLSDPMYVGWRHERIRDAKYAEFVEQFIQAVKKHWPDALLQFEDFAQHNALALLKRYQNSLCCFNDDIQGTAAVTLGCLIAASRAAGSLLSQQRIVFLGAGSAGCGIAELIVAQMQLEGISEAQARRQIFMVGRSGLLTDQMTELAHFKQRLAQPVAHLSHWPTSTTENFSLLDVVKNAKPSILIGVSAQPGLFDQTVVQTMHQYCAHPIIMPLSNPTSHVEAHPADLLAWTQGAALVATGSPFAAVTLAGQSYPIAQCNNTYIFPGLGLGVLACKAQRITEKMLLAASHALADCSPLARHGNGPLLPPLDQIQQVSRTIGFQVAKTAQQQGLATAISDEQLMQEIERNFWQPIYRSYRYQPN